MFSSQSFTWHFLVEPNPGQDRGIFTMNLDEEEQEIHRNTLTNSHKKSKLGAPSKSQSRRSLSVMEK